MLENLQEDRYLIFQLGDKHLGFDMKYIQEITELQPITTMPGVPIYMRGIINLRGAIIPIVDIKLKFEKTKFESTNRGSIIVLDVNNIKFAVLVDCVEDLIIIEESQINKISDNFYDECLKGIYEISGEVKILLDAERLISTLHK